MEENCSTIIIAYLRRLHKIKMLDERFIRNKCVLISNRIEYVLPWCIKNSNKLYIYITTRKIMAANNFKNAKPLSRGKYFFLLALTVPTVVRRYILNSFPKKKLNFEKLPHAF